MSEFHGNPAKKQHQEKLKKAAKTAHSHETKLHKERDAPVPPQEPGHPKSHAMNLGAPGSLHAKPAGNLRQGLNPGARRQP